MKMKYILSLTTALFLLASPILAHPPSDITASYDPASKYLTVRVFHNTFNTRIHYIKYVSVSVNGSPMLVQNFRSQLNSKEQDVVFLTPDLQTGMTVEVNGKCSLFGEKTKQITLGNSAR
jgi:hypothetical protein